MVQIKQKSNKINITALITCFMLIMVFVFGCAQFAFADESFNKAIEYVRQNDNREYTDYYYIYYNCKNEKRDMINVSAGKVSDYDFIGVLQNTFSSNHYRFYCKLKGSDTWQLAYQDSKEYISCWATSQYHGYDKLNGMDCYISMFGSDKDNFNISANFPIYVVDFNPSDYDASYVINRLSNYGLADNVNFDYAKYNSDIPTPKNLEIYFDRKLNKPFNLADLCNPLKIKWAISSDEDYSGYMLDVQIDVNYNKLNSISGIGTKPTVLQTGKVEFASCSATDKELNISATYDGWTKLSEKYQASTWGLTGNYFDLWLRYKDSSGNYGNWVKVTINPDNSSTVIKAGLFDNGTNTTINKGYEEISGDNGEHVNGDYDNYYVNTSDENISNNLTALKNNYSNLVSFYKELFSFLPAEIWIILIGLVSTMVVIAIIKFVRG